MPVWLLQVVTIVSTCGWIGSTVWGVTQAYRRERAEHRVSQLLGEKHAGRFHRCHEHDSIGIGGLDERSVDLTEMRQRWESHYRHRED